MTTTVDRRKLTERVLLDRLWTVHGKVERALTEQSLRLILAAAVEAAPNTVTHLELTYGDSDQPAWGVTYDDDDRGVHEVDAYDLSVVNHRGDTVRLSDHLSDLTPSFWLWMSHLLTPFTETAYVEVDQTFGMVNGAIFTPEFITSPRTHEQVRAIELARHQQIDTRSPCPDCGAPLDVTRDSETCTNATCTYAI